MLHRAGHYALHSLELRYSCLHCVAAITQPLAVFPFHHPFSYLCKVNDHRHIITTSDGSHTLYHQQLDEHYHSTHGAIQEAKHVFIQAGLEHVKQRLQHIRILEMGFGTGLNAFITYQHQKDQSQVIDYTGLEAFPLALELVNQLNYLELLKAGALQNVFQQMHTSSWNTPVAINEKFQLLKLHDQIQTASFAHLFDLVYFDAFGPRVQPECWTHEVFERVYATMASEGVLVTYCAKGVVKRTLKAVGFELEALEGPPGKREMTRATKP